MEYMKKFFKHLNKIIVHKFWVGYYCFIFHIPIQGLLHDLSKFSPTEFFESVKYYQGDKSPIDACKKENGMSIAWQHHKGRNKHHYEYWMDNFDNGGTPLLMPPMYAIEMLADYLGAGKAYMGNKFSYENEYSWWLNKIKNPLAMHPMIKAFITSCLAHFASNEIANEGDYLVSIHEVNYVYETYHTMLLQYEAMGGINLDTKYWIHQRYRMYKKQRRIIKKLNR